MKKCANCRFKYKDGGRWCCSLNQIFVILDDVCQRWKPTEKKKVLTMAEALENAAKSFRIIYVPD